MIYGYIRVSSMSQVDGASPDEQAKRIQAGAVLAGGSDAILFSDLGVSGSIPLAKRKGGAQLLLELKPGDTLIVAKMDRIFRSAVDALTMADQWKQDGINLILLDMGIEPVNTSGVGKLFFTMMVAMAEFERHRIYERTIEGRAAKKSRGGHIGGKRPFGFIVTGTGRDAVLSPHPGEQAALEDAKRMLRSGESLRKTVAKIAEQTGHKISHEALRRLDKGIKYAKKKGAP